MSVPVFLRKPNGTAWEGRIAYSGLGLRANHLRINYDERAALSTEDIYALYGVCPALCVLSSKNSNREQLDCIYKFLYGYTLEQLMEVHSVVLGFENYKSEPQEWTREMVKQMNWDLFCATYYTFLCSQHDFKSKAWKIIEFILNTLKASPDILSTLLSRDGRPSDATACSEFWETVCDGFQIVIRNYLSEETCYTAFECMTSVRPFFSDERFQLLEDECAGFFDEIAKRRIDDACQNKYTVRELVGFNIELLFFYKDYFASSFTTDETQRYVTHAVFTLLHTKGDIIASSGEVLGADSVYTEAMKYAQDDIERLLVLNKRNVISYPVAVARAEQEKRRRKEIRKQKASDMFEKFLIGLFLVSLVATVLFGLLAVLGVFKAFSKIACIVSLCILAPYLIGFLVMWIRDDR